MDVLKFVDEAILQRRKLLIRGSKCNMHHRDAVRQRTPNVKLFWDYIRLDS